MRNKYACFYSSELEKYVCYMQQKIFYCFVRNAKKRAKKDFTVYSNLTFEINYIILLLSIQIYTSVLKTRGRRHKERT